MKKFYLISTVVASLLFGAQTDTNIQMISDINITQQAPALEEAIIIFKPGINMGSMISKMGGLLSSFTHHEFKLINGMHIKVKGTSFETIKNILLTLPFIKDSIESIEPNYAFKPMATSNDSYYSNLWTIENTGQEVNGKSGTNDADMDVKEAWDITTGSKDVVVAVLDTGIDYTHNDLADNMWNGSTKHGVDFAGDDDGNNDDDPMPEEPYNENGHYHGTHVAGIIGAIGNNNNGVSGVAQKVQIMAVKIFRPNGYGYASDILEGLDYVSDQVDAGVNVVAINASYGGGGKSGDSMEKAIIELGKKGVVFCAAAGNDGKDIDSDPVYPASYNADNIITIAASDQDDNLASFSNYGANSVDVAAPGTNILNTYPENKYVYLQGTSMATPNVTGTVALLSSVDPDSSVESKINAIKSGVDVKSTLDGKVSTSGRVNTFTAVKSLDSSSTNHNPVANTDSSIAEYETKIIIDVLANDSDTDGDTLTIKSITQPKNGSVEIIDGKIEYTPNSGFSGDDIFNYTITDGNGANDSANVTVTVNEKPNTPPEAKSQNITINEDSKKEIELTGKDIDNDNLTFKVTREPSNGALTGTAPNLTYTPNKNYSGKDSFAFVANDGTVDSKSAVVNIVINSTNDAPLAKDDSVKTDEDKEITIDVLANDSDNDGDSLTIKSVTNATNGKVEIKDGKIIYTPNSNFNGKDSFTYTIEDSSATQSSATVNIVIDSINDAPLAKNDNVNTKYETKVTINVLENDRDIDGDNLTIKSVTEAKNGNVEIKDGKIEYTPNSGFSGNDLFNYQIKDSNGANSTGTVNIIVESKPNTPPVANEDSVKTDEDKEITIDVLSNDSDNDGDSLTIKSVTEPKNGTTKIYNGQVEYIPNSNYNGDDSFTYTIEDSSKATATAKVNIVIKAINDAPLANDDSAQTDINKTVTVDVINNDSDIDGDSLIIESISTPTYGDVVINNGKVDYTPHKDFSGKDSFTYKISDGELDSEATVNIEVKKANNIELPIIKIDPIENIFKMFTKTGELILKDNGLYSFNNDNGDIELDKENNTALFRHNTIPTPIEAIKLDDFKIDASKLELKFKMNSNIRF